MNMQLRHGLGRSLLILVLIVAGAHTLQGAVITAHTEVVNSTPGQFVPLEIGTPMVGYTDRLVWSEFPTIVAEQPLHVWQVAGLASPGQTGPGPDPSPSYGIVSFNVIESGPVWLAVTTRFGGGGNPSGNWIPELTSRSQLESEGWTEIATDLKTFDVPTQSDFDYFVFERESFAGESFTYRTEKYHPPLLLTTQFNVDAEPPEITGISELDSLWPPNHKMVSVNLQFETMDNEASASELFESLQVTVTSSEPDSIRRGDRPGDVDGFDGFSVPVDVTDLFELTDSGLIEGMVDLRAERLGDGDGRTYSIEASVTDAAGNGGIFALHVMVPHDVSQTHAVPEPSTFASLALAVAALFSVARRVTR